MDASHPRYVIDHNRCILCARCVRMYDEIEGAYVWDVMGRGANSRVITDLNQPWGTSRSYKAAASASSLPDRRTRQQGGDGCGNETAQFLWIWTGRQTCGAIAKRWDRQRQKQQEGQIMKLQPKIRLATAWLGGAPAVAEIFSTSTSD